VVRKKQALSRISPIPPIGSDVKSMLGHEFAKVPSSESRRNNVMKLLATGSTANNLLRSTALGLSTGAGWQTVAGFQKLSEIMLDGLTQKTRPLLAFKQSGSARRRAPFTA
jgi:hypothetical protein